MTTKMKDAVIIPATAIYKNPQPTRDPEGLHQD